MTPSFETIPYGFCHCGCGFKTKLARCSNAGYGHKKGEPFKYILGHQSKKFTPEYTVEERGYKTPCWVWARCCDSGGYGIKRDRRIFGGMGKQRPAHIIFWETEHGPTPEGKELHHMCEVRACVNPEHLEPLTRLEHRRKRRHTNFRPSSKTHCKYGHEFNESNTYVHRKGRACKICARRRVKEWEARQSLIKSIHST